MAPLTTLHTGGPCVPRMPVRQGKLEAANSSGCPPSTPSAPDRNRRQLFWTGTALAFARPLQSLSCPPSALAGQTIINGHQPSTIAITSVSGHVQSAQPPTLTKAPTPNDHSPIPSIDLVPLDPWLLGRRLEVHDGEPVRATDSRGCCTRP